MGVLTVNFTQTPLYNNSLVDYVFEPHNTLLWMIPSIDVIFYSIGIRCIFEQVITWFQNRRAKQKRDLEEMKNDLKTVSYTAL